MIPELVAVIVQTSVSNIFFFLISADFIIVSLQTDFQLPFFAWLSIKNEEKSTQVTYYSSVLTEKKNIKNYAE